ncbi:MAG TPA: regulatory iron-sulfur-containing complex subunit RicT [Phycisphaerae bacterium]|nr:regulatory iron-sulfur-containing complex subunit RicT [Phycisphaerae bacterium]
MADENTQEATPMPEGDSSSPAEAQQAKAEAGRLNDAREGEAAAPAEAASPAAPPSPPEPEKPTVVVRYGATGLVGRFVCMIEGCNRGQAVVVKSDRGQEMGEVICPCTAGCFGEAMSEKIVGEVLRTVSHADEVELRHMHDSESREMVFCRERIAAQGLPMKLVEAEHLFGGDRIIFYFQSEQRVDFRALVRDLAHEFQTRIEMRQIGARDEARLLGDYERCGRPLCCRAWIKNLAPVSMRMAKQQKATLDPAKISGHCGRLMCCLRFEHETYRELAKNLPRRNTYVSTPDGAGKVVKTDVVTQMVSVQLSGGKRISVPVESILERDLDPKVFEKAESPVRRESERGGGRKAAGGGGVPADSSRPRRDSSAGFKQPATASEGVQPSNRDKAAGEPASTPGAPGASAGKPGVREAARPAAPEGEKRSRRRRGGRGRRRSRRKDRSGGGAPDASGGTATGPNPPDASPPQAPEGH